MCQHFNGNRMIRLVNKFKITYLCGRRRPRQSRYFNISQYTNEDTGGIRRDKAGTQKGLNKPD
jgi:hypothetical protein